MARKTRSAKRGVKIFRRVYSPVYHTVEAARNASRSVLRGSERILNAGLGALQGVGTSVAKHGDMMIRDVFSRKSRKNSRRNRRATRRNRK
jgi:hypothetical protein